MPKSCPVRCLLSTSVQVVCFAHLLNNGQINMHRSQPSYDDKESKQNTGNLNHCIPTEYTSEYFGDIFLVFCCRFEVQSCHVI